MNPQWNMCSKGRRQSPINVEPDKLLFDPYLRVIHLDKHKVIFSLLESNICASSYEYELLNDYIEKGNFMGNYKKESGSLNQYIDICN